MMASFGASTCSVNIDSLSLAFVELRHSMACIGFQSAVPERRGPLAGKSAYSEKNRIQLLAVMLVILTVAFCDESVFHRRFDIGRCMKFRLPYWCHSKHESNIPHLSKITAM
jgi:hypothetical protein